MADQLRIAQGWVRCGQCQSVYKAYDTLTLDKETPAASPTQTAQNVPENKTKLQRIAELVAEKKAQAEKQADAPESTKVDEPSEETPLFLDEMDLADLVPDTEILYESLEKNTESEQPSRTVAVLKYTTSVHTPQSAPEPEPDTQTTPETEQPSDVLEALEQIAADNSPEPEIPSVEPEPEPSAVANDAANALQDTPELRKKLQRLERRRKKILAHRKKKAERAAQDEPPVAAPVTDTDKPDTAQPKEPLADEAASAEASIEAAAQIETPSATELEQPAVAQTPLEIDAPIKENVDEAEPSSGSENQEVVDNSAAITSDNAIPAPEAANKKATTEATEDLSFIRKAQRRAFWGKPKVRIALAAGIVFGCVGLAAQMLFYWRTPIYAQVPLSRSALNALCHVTGCTIAPWQNIEAITIENSYFRKLEYTGYRLGISLRNTSRHRVAMPALELVLLDHNEQALVRRIITDLPAPPTLPPRGEWTGAIELHVKLSPELQQRGLAGYRVSVLYVSPTQP